MKKNYILFDLDGTLTDSSEGIFNSIIYALNTFGIQIADRQSLRPFLGPPLVDSMETYFGFDRPTAFLAVERYREYFKDRGLLENRLYPGVDDLLKTLKGRGHTLYLATSKPEVFTRTILDHFGLTSYFDFIGGATLDESRVKKADVIRYVLQETNLQDLRNAVMVGDRKHDIAGAKANGLESIGVLYGYGDREELEQAGASFLARTVEEIAELV